MCSLIHCRCSPPNLDCSINPSHDDGQARVARMQDNHCSVSPCMQKPKSDQVETNKTVQSAHDSLAHTIPSPQLHTACLCQQAGTMLHLLWGGTMFPQLHTTRSSTTQSQTSYLHCHRPRDVCAQVDGHSWSMPHAEHIALRWATEGLLGVVATVGSLVRTLNLSWCNHHQVNTATGHAGHCW